MIRRASRGNHLSRGLACWARGSPDTVEHARRRISLTPTEGLLPSQPEVSLLVTVPSRILVLLELHVSLIGLRTLQPGAQVLPSNLTWASKGGLHVHACCFSARKWHTCVVAIELLSCVRLSATLWTPAHQASLSFPISQSLLKLMSTYRCLNIC